MDNHFSINKQIQDNASLIEDQIPESKEKNSKRNSMFTTQLDTEKFVYQRLCIISNQ